jgi:hypothetical protein
MKQLTRISFNSGVAADQSGSFSQTKAARALQNGPRPALSLVATAIVLCASWLALDAAAQTPPTLPLSLDQNEFLYRTFPVYTTKTPPLINWQSFRGVPISTNVGAGSDGRAPTLAQQIANNPTTTLPPSPGQFRGFVPLSAVAVQHATNLNTSQDFAANVGVGLLNWPRLQNGQGQVVAILRASQVGAPYLQNLSAQPFGSVLSPPLTDERGVTLTNQPNYWFATPFPPGAANTPYYFSTAAQTVFATQPGQIAVVWEKTVPTTFQPTNLPPFVGWTLNNNSYYLLYTNLYLVSGEAVKPPQKIYWTEGSHSLGYRVVVPSSVTVNVIYNKNFPQYVAPPGDPALAASGQATNTLWVDTSLASSHFIKADNITGRVFLEMLGPPNGGGSVPFLGFEIVDVYSDPVPVDVNVELGTRVPAYQDRRDDSQLMIAPNQNQIQSQFYYSQTTANGTTLWATHETFNTNDFEHYWLNTGVAGIQWPFLFDRYHEYWPSDLSEYVNYVRTEVTNRTQAALTAVQLPASEAPTIAYQDNAGPNLGAFITADEKFYTYLDPTFPVHRTLLQFLSGNNVAYERVFSWLDVNLKGNNFSGTVATNLPSVMAYPTNLAIYQTNLAIYQTNLAIYYTNLANYPSVYSNYLYNLPVKRQRGVNGTWVLYCTDYYYVGGSINSLAVLVDTVDQSNNVATTEFDGPGFNLPNQYFGTVTVSGVTNAVTNVRIKFGGISSPYPPSLWFGAASPINYAVMAFPNEAPPNPISNVALTFDDTSPIPFYEAYLYGPTLLPNTYQPYDSIVANLLAPAPVPPDPPSPPTPPTPPSPWSNTSVAPLLATATVNVGNRIAAPAGELGSATNSSYLAGYILQTNGNSFNPRAYVDPFANGFVQAGQGAIIPVNAIPGANVLEVWWFRQDNMNGSQGFLPSYWPAVIADYTIQWPADADEIILASNDGTGQLDPLQAKGTIYRQNDPAQPGYNPNEEHAVLLGGQAYALRDDLNITNPAPGESYSSAPYVLIDYTSDDGRPKMHAFHVRREKPEAGILFDHVADAGSVLQPPMPLPLLEPPVEIIGGITTNYNTEPPATSSDLPVGFTNLPANSYYNGFVFQDRKHEFWVYRGLNQGLPALQVGAYNVTNNTFGPLPPAIAVVGQPFTNYIHLSRRMASLTAVTNSAPDWIQLVSPSTNLNDYALVGTPALSDLGTNFCSFSVADTDGSSVTNTLSINVVSNGLPSALGPLAITSSNQYSGQIFSYSNRPPFLAQSPVTSNSFTMRFYYKNQPTFDWPGSSPSPNIGDIVPYLRPVGSTNAPGSKFSPSLDIVYRPVWPSLINGQPLPTLQSGQTLTDPVHNLAAVRGQSSVQVLYQQSLATNNITGPNSSVTLFDPTVQKISNISNGLPPSVNATFYQGRYYFPNLPPNLVNRVFYDPGTSDLVLQGQFVAPAVGDSYLLLNVLAGTDLAAVEGLCPAADPSYGSWLGVVTHLATPLYTFHDDTNGNYVVVTNPPQIRYVSDLVAITNSDQQVDSYALSANGPGIGYISYIVGNGNNPAHAGEPVTVYIAQVAPGQPPQPGLYPGQLVVIPDPNPLSESISFQHTLDLAGQTSNFQYDWQIAPPVDGQPPVTDSSSWTELTPITNDVAHFTLGAATGIQSLGDNYVRLRYRQPGSPIAANTNWSVWTAPVLAEGYIKRVLAGINPFDQRTSDLFDNPVNTIASIISQAGHRWEGDVALNADTITNAGLIQIYETVLHRGEALSINAPGGGINYGPANDALLLAAGYLSDLYSFVANDALADAGNPTIGIGTSDKTYGSIATALFSFQGQEPSLLEQELALLRGRNDALSPGVQLAPVYNRLFWNYTRGIAAGEVIYALNYNILDENGDGVVNAADAAILYPMGHGDAYGHYLTALNNYIALLMNPNFDWVPQIETVSVLGAPVSVGYEHERKFAATAAALANTGLRVFDLTWRENYHAGTSRGWGYFDTTQVNSQRPYSNAGVTNYVTGYWGMDHWAARAAQGAYLNWVVGNAILPPVDPDPTHQGIQKIDRTTVAELNQLPQIANQVQTDMQNAEAGFTPFDLSQNAIPFDINPLQVTGANPQTHFEQVYQRAVQALNNAVVAFNDAQNVRQLMRSEEDSLTDFQAGVVAQELAYNNELVELYGTPYPDDMGPGKTYPQGYNGPDLLHYTYVENPDTNTFNGILADPTTNNTYYLDAQSLPSAWATNMYDNFTNIIESTASGYMTNTSLSVPLIIGPDGFFGKPPSWTSQRGSPGQIQAAISTLVSAAHTLRQSAVNEGYDKSVLDKNMEVFKSMIGAESNRIFLANSNLFIQNQINDLNVTYNILNAWVQFGAGIDADLVTLFNGTLPDNIADVIKPLRTPVIAGLMGIKWAALLVNTVSYTADQASVTALQNTINNNAEAIANSQLDTDTKNAVLTLGTQLGNLQGDLTTINKNLRALSDAQAAYQALVAKGLRIQSDRLTYRQHAAALVQGFRTRDAAFRLFQNEKLQRYLTLFDLAAKYSYLAAQAYDYETGLLGTSQGQNFLNQIISAQALGVVANGQPQYSSSASGDPGLAGALAQMDGDWQVLKGRLGFNNPDGYGTTVSLRSENFRVLPSTNGDSAWQQVLQQSRVADLRADSDVMRHCLQIDDGSGLPVPGIVLSFSTTVANGQNLFGNLLAPGDHNYSPSSFATKIFATGVCLDGYIGMDNPSAGGGITPPDPTLDPNALAATPYVYLIPVGQDSMRSPPLGDASTIRSWNVDDVAVPLPFNISAADFSSTPFYTSANSLSEPLFAVREHQAFRPVSTTSVFNTSIYGATGALQPTEYTNKRLIGRSIWNSKWKLVIPGRTLLADPNQGIDRFIQSVKDVHLYFITYSYAGN